MGLTKLAINRPVFIMMLMAAAIILGLVAMNTMRVELQPDVSFPAVTISTVYPGAGPEEIETLITRKIEDAVSSVSSIREVTSTSQEGISVAMVSFEIGTDINVAADDVRNKIDSIRSNLPKDADAPTILKFESTSQPIIYLTVSSPRPSRELRDLADQVLKDRFSRISGVGSVVVAGGDEREILISVDRDKLTAYGVPITRVLGAIRGATQNVPAGRSIEGNREFSVRVYGEFQSVDEIRDLDITLQNRANPMAKGPVIKLRDVATITDTIKERTTATRLSGQDSIALIFQKTTQGNAVSISKALKKEIAALTTRYPDLKFTVISDQATHVQDNITDLKTSLFLGIALVVGIIFLFLHNLRGTIIVALAIPTCIFGTFLFIKAMGFTLNMMTMLALSLAVGVLVDDAIVVLENIYRHLTMKEDPPVAALNGRMEIGLAAIVITMVDVAVFLPIATMGGIMGQFFRSFGLTVACATLLSLFVSFTVTPMLAARWYRKGEDLEDLHGFFRGFESIWQACVRAYRYSLDKALRRRWLTLFLGAGILVSIFMLIAGSYIPSYAAGVKSAGSISIRLLVVAGVLAAISVVRKRAEWLKAGLLVAMWAGMFFVALMLGTAMGIHKGQPVFQFRFQPQSDNGTVVVNLLYPAGTSLAATDREVRRIEDLAFHTRDVKYVFSSIGATSAGLFGSGDSGSQFAQIQITLNDKRSLGEALTGASSKAMRMRSDVAVADELRDRIGKVPDALITVSAVSGWGISTPIMISLYGKNTETVTETAFKVRDVLNAIPGIVDTDISSKPGKPEIRASVDRERLADANLTVADLGAVMRIAYAGDDTTKYRESGNEYPIRVRMDEKARNDVGLVGNVPVAFAQNGGLVTLDDVTHTKLVFGPTKITRRDKQREVQVTANLLPGYNPGSMQPVIDKKLDQAGLPPAGVTKAWQGENKLMADEMPNMFGALLLSLILVYMLMASLFDNLLYPFIIMLSQPQALAGALLALIVTNTTLDIVGFIGFIMLVGLVGKNAILLVDYTNTLRKRGRNRHDALVEAGPTRLRPITMTTLAMVFAMLPIAMALGRGSEFRAPMGIVVIGGLAVSTLLTLLVIPCAYTVVDDFVNWVSHTILRRPVAVGAGGTDTPDLTG